MFFDTATKPGAERSVPRKNRDRAVAIGGSLAMHVVLLAAFFGGATGDIISGGGAADGGDTVFEISLTGPDGEPAPSGGSPDQAKLDALFRRTMVEQSAFIATTEQPRAPSRLSALFETAEPGPGEARDTDAPRRAPTSDDGGKSAPADARRTATPRGAADTRQPGEAASPAASTGALWGQIEPCWRRMPNTSDTPVSLEVTINARGLIAAPPKIIRPTDAPLSPRRLVAESRALAALSACVPYRTLGSSGDKAFVVDFKTLNR
jgi:hypothetical protein